MREAFGATFDIPDGYLNTASSGVPSIQTGDAVSDSIARWSRGLEQSPDHPDPVSAARSAFGTLVGFPADQVVSGATVSQLAGLVAANLPDDARVLVAKDDFTSVLFPFAAQQDRGVEVTEVELCEVGARAADYDVVAVSVVQSCDGRIVDLSALREAARTGRTRVFLDISQAVGWMPLELGWAHWVAGAQYKFLLALRGAAWMAVSPQAGSLRPHSANWWAGEDPWETTYGLPLRLASTRRALDLSPTWFSQIGGAVSMSWFAGLDMTKVAGHCTGLADGFRAGLGMEPAGSAIVAVDRPAAMTKLTEYGIRYSQRAGKIRLAFHLYNTADDVERGLRAFNEAG